MSLIHRQNVSDILPLTPMQEGMLYYYLKEGGDAYFEQLSLDISGVVDSRLFENAWQKVVDHNEMLRTRFRWEELDQPVQIILNQHRCRIIYHDLTGVPPGEVETRLDEVKKKDKADAFELREVPFRVTLCKLGTTHHCMIVSSHHILFDGWSNGILLKEFFEAFKSLQRDAGLPPVEKTKFRAFTTWLRQQNQSEQQKFWQRYLRDFDSLTQLPLLAPVDAEIDNSGGMEACRFSFHHEEHLYIDAFLKKEKLTSAVLFYSTWGVLLQRYNNSNESVFGATVSGRPSDIKGIEDMVGLFINTLPLRIQTQSGQTVRQLLTENHQMLEEWEQFQHTPLVKVKEYASLHHKEELFNSILVLENYPLSHYLTEDTGSLKVNAFDMAESTPYDLTVGITLFNGFQVQLGFPCHRFEKEAVERMALHFKILVLQILRQWDDPVSQLNFLPGEEKEKLLYQWNDTAAPYPVEKTLHGLFEDQVRLSPDAIATIQTAPNQVWHLTYNHLNSLAGQMAQYLRDKGVQTEDIVAVKMNQSLKYAIALFGIMKAGAAYLPIDPEYPEDRIDFMLKDSQASFLLESSDPFYTFCHSSRSGNRFEGHTARGNNTAYTIYTSGTTGTPKGVAVEHHSVVNLLSGRRLVYRMHAGWLALQLFAPSFDGFVAGFFSPLVCGAKLVLPSREEIRDVIRIIHIIRQFHVNHFVCVPPLYRAIAETITPEEAQRLEVVAMGGDIILPTLVQKTKEINPNIEMINEYGVTECTVSSVIACHVEKAARVTIGFPTQNAQVYILDGEFRLMPLGIPGELWLGGAGVARGYLNRPELTSEKFMPLPLSPSPLPIYRTGDLARWLSDGSIQLLGRIDSQVKIRGFRIELGEIENRISRFPGIKQAVVVIRERQAGDKYLCAYIVFKEESKTNFEPLKTFLSQGLPNHMIPSHFITINRIPLTPNGKLDRKVLPLPWNENEISTFTPPRGEVEIKVAHLFQELLNIPSPGRDTDFFAMGGHSLKAMVLVSKIAKAFNVKVELKDIFRAPTVRGIAGIIRETENHRLFHIHPVEKKEYYPLSSAQKRLFFLDRFEDIGVSYNMPAINPVKGPLDLKGIEATFQKLLQRHETLRTSFHIIGDMPVQQIHESVFFQVEQRSFHSKEKEQVVKALIRPFDLSRAPLFRVILLVPETPVDQAHYLFFDMHHIISDGTSVGVLVEEFTRLYNGDSLNPLSIQYKDFSIWQNRLFDEGKIQDQEQYWMDLFRGEIPRVNLPADRPRPPVFDFRGDRFRVTLEPEDTQRIREMSQKLGVTLFMNLLTAYNVLLHRYTQQEDIIVGASIAGRRDDRLQSLIGMFVNALAMRNFPTSREPYHLFLQRVKKVCIDAYENQDVQFEALVEKLDPERDASRNPIFDVCLVVQNFNPIQAGIEGLTLDAYGYENKTTKFDLTLFVYEPGDQILFDLEYYTAIFDRESIQQLARHFVQILRSMSAKPQGLIAHMEMLNPDEKQHLLETFNQTAAPYPENQTVHHLFSRQVQQNPHHIAVKASSDIFATLTFQELEGRANEFARYVAAANINPDKKPVVLLMENSHLLIIAMLGILKAGACYLPLDPATPLERLKMIIDDAAVPVVVSQKKYIHTLNRIQWECDWLHTIVCLDTHHILMEEETVKSSLMDEELWNYVGQTATDEITGGGWNSSYTGLPFSNLEMQEYGDNVLKKLLPLLTPQMRVLEIGCASGISMYRIAPKVSHYFGTDLSPVIIQKNKERVAREEIENISLMPLPAHQIHQLKGQKFDLIVINSVIQSFHGLNYLRNVLRQCMDLLSDQGYIFCGDIMDLDKKQALIDDLVAFKNQHKDDHLQYTTKTDWSTELFVSRRFFRDLLFELPGINDVTFSEKIYTVENELTRFRYDVLLQVSKDSIIPSSSSSKFKHQHDLSYIQKYRAYPLSVITTPHDPAYIIYTSGTTGRPKGVMISHQSLIDYISWATNRYLSEPGKQGSPYFFPLYTTPAFDLTITSIFVPLLSGNGIIIYPYDDQENRFPLEAILEQDQVQIIKATPSHLKLLRINPQMGSRNTRVKGFIVGGESLEASLALHIQQRFNHPVTIYNEYGPTEATVGCILYEMKPGEKPIEEGDVPIGFPAYNTVIYLMDSFLNPVPVNAVGEIYIGGIGLAQGYVNLPELTAERFISNPFNPRERLYASGDLAVRMRNGCIRFLGRRDQQVKIRGYRIETQEIENKLILHEDIREALVIARTDDQGDPFLCAYLISKQGREIDVSALREFLVPFLPDYMIPAHYALIEKIPLTVNGKLDIQALPEPAGISTPENYTAPTNNFEQTLIRIWSEILNIPAEHIGIHDHFFRLGGHSLKATLMTAKIHQELGVKVPLAEIFKQPYIHGLAQYIQQARPHDYCPIEPAEPREFYPLSFAQNRLYVMQRLNPSSTVYNMPGMTSLYRITGSHSFSLQRINHTLQQLTQRHESLRTSFHMQEHQPMQKVAAQVELSVETYSSKDQMTAFVRSFDLSQAPLLRVGVVTEGDHQNTLFIDMHHIISDDISFDILARDFHTLYNDEILPPMALQYKDFAVWQNSPSQKEAILKQETFWLEQFSFPSSHLPSLNFSPVPILNLPTDFPRPLEFHFLGHAHHFNIPEPLTTQVKQLAANADVTVMMVLLALYILLLSRFSRQEELLVGIVSAGRPHIELQSIIGFFINLLPVIGRPQEEKAFSQYLAEIKETAVHAYDNQDYPLEMLIEKLQIPRQPGRHPLIDASFNLLEVKEHATGHIPEDETEPEDDSFYNNAHFDLSLQAVDHGQYIHMRFEYSSLLFKEETIAQLSRYFTEILEQVISDPNILLRDIKVSHALQSLETVINEDDADDWDL